ncbi:hypothetical protein RJT34_13127 [Clitoria ternatea]|uniref:Uncharacterized protein n=1 Tax=Clitoria ternatea TaxID=43366 RepID=A0AAN9JR04_CLITE
MLDDALCGNLGSSLVYPIPNQVWRDCSCTSCRVMSRPCPRQPNDHPPGFPTLQTDSAWQSSRLNVVVLCDSDNEVSDTFLLYALFVLQCYYMAIEGEDLRLWKVPNRRFPSQDASIEMVVVDELFPSIPFGLGTESMVMPQKSIADENWSVDRVTNSREDFQLLSNKVRKIIKQDPK